MEIGRNCTKCGEYKEWSSFSIEKAGKNGRSARCKKCQVEYTMYRYNKDKTKFFKANERRRKRQRGGVYIVYTDEGTYIGESGNIKYRVEAHKCKNAQSKVGSREVTGWEVLEYIEDPVLRLQRETYWIDKLKPKLNTLGVK